MSFCYKDEDEDEDEDKDKDISYSFTAVVCSAGAQGVVPELGCQPGDG